MVVGYVDLYTLILPSHPYGYHLRYPISLIISAFFPCFVGCDAEHIPIRLTYVLGLLMLEPLSKIHGRKWVSAFAREVISLL